ncbi:MAG: MBL fold metallo-hydrolase, partial [Paramuribaculum sp.]|nr:MBL fold metallo-hydrolase [Paramuribaculum sp.]
MGIDDPSVRVFEAQYPTPYGMSYNSYVIADRRIAVLDSVESGGGERWIAGILDATGGRLPDYLVVQHMEPDHSANILMALDRFPALKIVTSAPAAKMLPQFFPEFDFSDRVAVVKEGDNLSLGEHTLRFLSAPMVHWPEVIVSYEEKTGTLFSADAFGKFGAISHEDDWVSEARRYYVNIVGRYGAQVASLLKKLGGLDIVRIAPLHGPVLDGDLQRYIGLYGLWSSYAPEADGVLIAYASIYGGTAEAALDLAGALRSRGVGNVVAMDLTS